VETQEAFVEHDPVRLRPVARWVRRPDGDGRPRLAMVWSVPDVDADATRLLSTEA
jgi:hypothetical protein